MSLTKQILFEEEERMFAPSSTWNRYEREDGTKVTIYKNTHAFVLQFVFCSYHLCVQ